MHSRQLRVGGSRLQRTLLSQGALSAQYKWLGCHTQLREEPLRFWMSSVWKISWCTRTASRWLMRVWLVCEVA